MIKRSLLALLAALLLALPALAGDVATFVNLGFSPDSAYFMFGQYGAQAVDGKPYAEIYIVDTKRNIFAPKSSIQKIFDARLEAGQDGSGALFALFADTVPVAKSLKIDYLSPGRLLYALLDGEEAPRSLSFRDFKTDSAYEIVMDTKLAEDQAGPVSSFGLTVSRSDKDGTSRKASAGNPAIKRAGVRDYLIRRILVGPDGKTLVLVIEKRMVQKGDASVRYMVETLRLP